MSLDILVYNYEYPPLGGGGGVATKQIIDELAQRHRVTVVTSAFRGLQKYERQGNLEIHRVPVLFRTAVATANMPSMLAYWPSSEWAGHRLLRGRRFDVINSHFVVPSAPSADRLARRFGVPHVVSIHGGDIYDPSKKVSPHQLPVVRSLIHKILSRTTRVIAQSTNTLEHARKYYNVTRDIDIIPLGFIPAGAEYAARHRPEGDDEAFRIVTVGRLIARKGLKGLLRVFRKLDQARASLTIIGDGPERAELERHARELGVFQRVRFTGFVEESEKVRLLAAADVFASTSLHEGFGLVFLEAMYRGLPVVAYDFGGQTDFLASERTGFLIPLRDEDAFVRALQRLQEQPEFRRKCGEHNRGLSLEYTVEVCARRYEELFYEVARKGSKKESASVSIAE